MSQTFTLPLWAIVLIGALALLSLIHHFLLPSVRWILRRRVNRVIDEVNQRLALQIPSFKLTRREVLIDRLVYHPDVIEAVALEAKEQQVPREVLMARVRTYAREIVPAFNAFLYFKCGYWVARRIVHLLYRVRLGFANDASLSDLSPTDSVVFLMNHRSNMDYILATYLAAEKTTLSYAVGEWARVWPLQQLIRLMGGFFVRRDSSNPLYRRVLQSYVQMAAEGGVPQAVFPEGRLSRDGHLAPPKLGLLGYLTKGFDPAGDRDIVFVPVGINYDRVLEDRTLVQSSSRKLPEKRGFFTLWHALRYVYKNLWLALRGRRYRNGYACVNFGEPVSLRNWLANHQYLSDPLATQPLTPEDPPPIETVTQALADDLMERVGEIIPVLPVALVATLFTQNPGVELTAIDIKTQVDTLIRSLEAKGHKVYIPRNNLDYAVTVGIRMLTMRYLLLDREGVLSANADETALLHYYAASIAHLVAE